MDKTKIIGVEIIPSAVEDARKNAQKNGIKNIEFKCKDVGEFLKILSTFKKNLISSIVLDPPRSGIAPKTLQKLIDFAAPEIIYVSCNPATLVRDTKTLEENDYKLEKIALVDQFPHTSHVECVTRFKLKE